MTATEFWQRMRDLRAALTEAGEQGWSDALRGSLAPTAHRADDLPDLVHDLEALRHSEVAARLHLVPTVEELLAMVADGSA